MAELRIAPDFALPIDLVVQQAAILARTGAGKTNAATVIAEELLAAGQQVVIIDPPGAWWGLTASADGGPDGYPIVVLGGEHGDLPLPPTGGALIADVVVDQTASVILDLSDLSNAQTSAFVLAFASRLYERKARARSPLLLVIEEADEVAPQRAMPDQTRMLGAIERVVKRGRMRGIGTLMISQRSASLNKNVLSQAELLIAMQTTAPQDIKAIDAWIEHHGDQERRQQLISEIATLGKGEAFVWSPGWLHAFRKIRFRLRRTFDSSATPKPGEVLIEPTARAAVNLDVIRAQLEASQSPSTPTSIRDQKRATAERGTLIAEQQQRINELERQLRERRAPIVERIEVPVLPPADVEKLTAALDDLRAVAMRIIDATDGIRAALVRARPAPASVEIVESPSRPSPPAEPRPRGKSASSPRTTAPSRAGSVQGPDDLSKLDRNVLGAVAALTAIGITAPSRAAVAGFAGYRQPGRFTQTVKSLEQRGLVAVPSQDALALTDAGRDVMPVAHFDTLADYHDAWRAVLRDVIQRRMFDVVLSLGRGASISRAALARELGYKQQGRFTQALGYLAMVGAVTYPGDDRVAPADLLFPEGLR